MVHRTIKIKPPVSTFKFYSSLTLGLSIFFVHSKELASSIIEHGTTITVSDSALKRRKAFGLPPSRFNESDLKKLAILKGLSTVEE